MKFRAYSIDIVMLVFILMFSTTTFAQETKGLVPDISTKIDGEYIGGLKDNNPFYNNQIKSYDYLVKTKSELLEALKKAKYGNVIFVPSDAEIDMTGHEGVIIRAGITLAGDRGKNNQLGGIIKTDDPDTYPLFKCGSNVTIKGLRFDGGDTNEYYNNNEEFKDKQARLEYKHKIPVSMAVKTNYSGLSVENCEFFGWTHAAIGIGTNATEANISYNYIHHNRRAGLGYGVVLDAGSADIKGNLFDYNRHDIAGTGVKGTSYKAYYNVFLENGTGHSVDMHGGEDRKDNTDIAGTNIEVYNNRFKLPETRRAVVIRGVPTGKAVIKNNVVDYINETKVSSLANEENSASKVNHKKYSNPFSQLYSKGRMVIGSNKINK